MSSNVKTCVQIEIRESYWGMIPLPTSSEIREATNIARGKIPSSARNTLKYIRVISQMMGSGGTNLNAGSSYNLDTSGIPGTKSTSSTSSLSLNGCCGTQKNPPQGLGSKNVYKVGVKKNPEIRTAPQANSSQLIINNFIFNWESPDVEYAYSVYQRARSLLLERIAKTNISPQSFVYLQGRLKELNSLWSSKNYEGLCGFCGVPYRTRKQSDILHKTTKPLLIFKKTNSEDVTYKNVWKCYSEHKGSPCCTSSSSSSSSSSCDCVSQSFCDDYTDCESFQGCVANPNCAYSPKGCCTDDCAEPCSQFGPPCSEPGATCKENCCWEGDCRYGPWDKTPADIPCNVSQSRIRNVLRGPVESCQDTTEIIIGTKDCDRPSGGSIDIYDLLNILESIENT
jgi:hypothetical protein